MEVACTRDEAVGKNLDRFIGDKTRDLFLEGLAVLALIEVVVVLVVVEAVVVEMPLFFGVKGFTRIRGLGAGGRILDTRRLYRLFVSSGFGSTVVVIKVVREVVGLVVVVVVGGGEVVVDSVLKINKP